MSQDQSSSSNCQKLLITSSVIVTDIPIKPQQFPTNSFRAACYRFFRSHDLDLGPMTLTLERDLDILQMHFQTEKEVARLSHLKGIAWAKNTKIVPKIKGQVQMSPTSDHIQHSPWDIFLQGYINFWSVVFEILCGQTDAQTDAAKNNTCSQLRDGRLSWPRHRNDE